jgi:hypothetical protein
VGTYQQFTEKERLLVGLVAARWHEPLDFRVDGAWFEVLADGRSWEISRADLDHYDPPELDALARRALAKMSGAEAFWPPLQRVFQSS